VHKECLPMNLVIRHSTTIFFFHPKVWDICSEDNILSAKQVFGNTYKFLQLMLFLDKQ
jgi:hypothetical protein